ncbi:MAG: hypothetical protein C5S47_04750 [Candidatus Methanogasteraceae archaeon]|nr:MAG: hypothetical protein C5S47_04750 [ANME-2 cluster archaeon]
MEESNRIELKRELTHSLEKAVIAFLNYREGGYIYIKACRIAYALCQLS